MAGGAPTGNTNAIKAKVWTMAIERALQKRSCGDRVQALDELAEKLLVQCEQGDLGALKELGDRLEGKPKQQVEISGDNENPLHLAIWNAEEIKKKLRIDEALELAAHSSD